MGINTDRVKNINFQSDVELFNRIAEVANRDHNGLSATIRRLISAGLLLEQRPSAGVGQ